MIFWPKPAIASHGGEPLAASAPAPPLADELLAKAKLVEQAGRLLRLNLTAIQGQRHAVMEQR